MNRCLGEKTVDQLASGESREFQRAVAIVGAELGTSINYSGKLRARKAFDVLPCVGTPPPGTGNSWEAENSLGAVDQAGQSQSTAPQPHPSGFQFSLAGPEIELWVL